jgi:segregation and condensation protein B
MPENPEYSPTRIRHIVEAALLAAGEPLSVAQLSALFGEGPDCPDNADLVRAIEQLQSDCADRGIELRKVASGYRLQVKQEYQEWISRLWSERPKRYSRALLETLALVAYRQPITRGEIEDVRGVSLSSNIIRTLQERDWIRVVGHRDVPGKPALFGTTRAFLDYFNLESLDELPTLAEIKDMDNLEPELDFEPRRANEVPDEGAGDDGDDAALEAAPADDGDEPGAPESGMDPASAEGEDARDDSVHEPAGDTVETEPPKA